MATMCFEKAGDAYREKLARAAGLLATADRVISTNFEMGQPSLQKASEIFESIGKHEKAATCYMKLGDYKKAGMMTVLNCYMVVYYIFYVFTFPSCFNKWQVSQKGFPQK